MRHAYEKDEVADERPARSQREQASASTLESFATVFRIVAWMCCCAWSCWIGFAYAIARPESAILQNTLAVQCIAAVAIGFAMTASFDRIVSALTAMMCGRPTG